MAKVKAVPLNVWLEAEARACIQAKLQHKDARDKMCWYSAWVTDSAIEWALYHDWPKESPTHFEEEWESIKPRLTLSTGSLPEFDHAEYSSARKEWYRAVYTALNVEYKTRNADQRLALVTNLFNLWSDLREELRNGK